MQYSPVADWGPVSFYCTYLQIIKESSYVSYFSYSFIVWSVWSGVAFLCLPPPPLFYNPGIHRKNTIFVTCVRLVKNTKCLLKKKYYYTGTRLAGNWYSNHRWALCEMESYLCTSVRIIINVEI